MSQKITSSKNTKKIAVVGATGNVGQALLSILAERGFPAANITAIASGRSVGRDVSYGEDAVIPVKSLDSYDFSQTDIALFSPGGEISAIHAPRAAAQGCIVIDNTSHFRMDPDIPLVIPEINGDTIASYKQRNIIANPNCSTIQLLMALKPLHDLSPIKRVVACTYQSVSGAGREGIDELISQTKGFFTHQNTAPKVFAKPIGFNVIPQIDRFLDTLETKEEWKMTVETKKILDPSIELVATCVRVPVLIGHSIATHVEFHNPLSVNQAHQALASFPGVQVHNSSRKTDFHTPAEIAGEDSVYVSRLRIDPTVPHGLSLWIVADNIRKGAALNAVQIAEELIEKYL